MIVRETPANWLLISQVDHARLAARLAADWELPALLAENRAEFLAAVAHHDDGWRDWERSPAVTADGRPRDFLNMPMPEATSIWSQSIHLAAGKSPWCGLWVSRHFCYLAAMAAEHRTDDADQAAIARFLDAQADLQHAFRNAAADDRMNGESQREQAGCVALQFFDRLSLWLCCAERREPKEFEQPGGGITRWDPVSPREIRVNRGLVSAAPLQLSVPTIEIPRRKYTRAQLRAEIEHARRGALDWRIARVEETP